MSGPQRPTNPEPTDPGTEDLQALYRESATEEPTTHLDNGVLAAAKAAARADGAATRPRPWWTRWLPATAALAVAVAGLSLTWRVMDQQEQGVRKEAGVSPAGDVSSRKDAPRTDAAAVRAGGPAAPRAAEVYADVQVGAGKDTAPAAAGPAASPPASRDAPVESTPVRPDAMGSGAAQGGLGSSRDAEPVRDAATPRARQSGKTKADGSAAVVFEEDEAGSFARPIAKSLSVPVAGATPVEDWLREIRRLRSAGRWTEASRSLARFRKQYPDFELPADLVDAK